MAATIGYDILIDNAGDIIMRDTGGGVDFNTISGLDEIAQAMTASLRTRAGEDAYRPENGLPIDRMLGVFAQPYIEGQISKQLLRDKRVASISSIQSELDRFTRRALVRISARLTNGEQLTIEEYFGS